MWLDRSVFVQKKIPTLHPLSNEYLVYWREEKRRIIEGVWNNGIWCPPQLYHYLNHATITLGEGKTRKKGRPFDLDYVWDLAYYWIEARGLSGFEKVGDVPDIRSFLRTRQKEDLGKPLYNNDSKNLLLYAGRGFGKSFWAANCAAHEFTTDGQKEYKPGEPVKEIAEILLSAYSTSFVNDLIVKVQDVLSNYPGGIEVNGTYYPPPFAKTISGSWLSGKKAEHYYKKKVGGKWQWFGTRSCFKPRVYKDNHQAAVGGRNTLKIGEEIGTWDNIIDSHFADENTQRLNGHKFGSTLYIGTGGDNLGEAALAVHKMMYDPEAYDCIAINDKWENRGKIGLFFPITYTKLNYKDELGNTNFEIAEKGEEKEREKRKKSKDVDAYDQYVVYNPLVPSEIFLAKNNNIFPLKDIQATLAMVESDQKLRDAEYIGDLLINTDGIVEWKNNPKNRPIYDFPLKAGAHLPGCPILYEQPILNEDGTIPWGRYIAGIDPYDHDTSNTDSLGSCIVLDKLTNRIVAEYTGRPETSREYYEDVRRLLIYYNAIALYENEKKGIFDYFESQGSLYLLAEQPKLIRDVVQNSTVQRGYGIHMTEEIKRYGEGLVNTWLRSTNNGELRNVHKIRCIPLLKELSLYNNDGNFDRVMALICCMYLKEEMRKIEVKQEEKVKSILDSDFFKQGFVRDKQGVYAIGKQGFF